MPQDSCRYILDNSMKHLDKDARAVDMMTMKQVDAAIRGFSHLLR
jgi:hypothetical protein